MTSQDSTLVKYDANRDETSLLPGPGIVLAAIRAVSPPTARVRVLGKGGTDRKLGPSVEARLRMQSFRGNVRRIVMVGDRFDTDVKTGFDNGWSTCLVETGCHRMDDGNMYPDVMVDMIASNISDLSDRKMDLREHVSSVLHDLMRKTPHGMSAVTWLAHRLGSDPVFPRRVRSVPTEMHLAS